jgi:hypothetical protein
MLRLYIAACPAFTVAVWPLLKTGLRNREACVVPKIAVFELRTALIVSVAGPPKLEGTV